MTRNTSLQWPDYARKIGINVQRIRVSRGLSQERVAYDSGLSRGTYQTLERGATPIGTASNITLRIFMAVAQTLGVTIDELLPEPWPDLSAR